MKGVVTLSNSTPDEYELYFAGSYDINELTGAKAKTNISTDINGGLTHVDKVRS